MMRTAENKDLAGWISIGAHQSSSARCRSGCDLVVPLENLLVPTTATTMLVLVPKTLLSGLKLASGQLDHSRFRERRNLLSAGANSS